MHWFLIASLAWLPMQQKSLYAQWEFPTALISSEQINRFELSLNAGEWTDVGRTASPDQTGVEAGSVRYESKLPVVPVGPHEWRVRACNVLECSEPLGTTFEITLKPSTPQKGRTQAREDK